MLATTEVDAHGRTAIFGGGNVLEKLGARAGNAILPGDSDGVTRHVPWATQGLTSFGIVAAEVAYPNSPIKRPAVSTPWIDFVGRPGRSPRTRTRA